MTFLEALAKSRATGCCFSPKGEEDFWLQVRKQQWRENGKLVEIPVIWMIARDDSRRAPKLHALEERDQFQTREEIGCPVQADLLLRDWETF